MLCHSVAVTPRPSGAALSPVTARTGSCLGWEFLFHWCALGNGCVLPCAEHGLGSVRYGGYGIACFGEDARWRRWVQPQPVFLSQVM